MEDVRRPMTVTFARTDPARAWIVVSLLFLFMLINFADRAVLGLAAVPIMQELELSHTQWCRDPADPLSKAHLLPNLGADRCILSAFAQRRSEPRLKLSRDCPD
jgi:hypothetical protein